MNILILYPSWEDRSVLGFEKDIEGQDFHKVVLMENANPVNKAAIAKKMIEVENICDDRGIPHFRIELDFGSPQFWKNLKGLIASFDNADRISLDISTMSRNLIWALLFFLKEKSHHVGIVYHQPHKYSNDWLSRDAEPPRLLFKHSGIVSMEKRTLLIIVTGFDVERTKQLVYYYNPSKIILLIQKPNRLDDNVRNTSAIHAGECEKMGAKADVEPIDCYAEDWGFSTMEAIVSRNLEHYNIIVSSIGPKLSAVSVYRTFLLHPEIALAYIHCKEYNPCYCEGIGDTFESRLEM